MNKARMYLLLVVAFHLGLILANGKTDTQPLQSNGFIHSFIDSIGSSWHNYANSLFKPLPNIPVVAGAGAGEVVYVLPFPNAKRTIRLTANQTGGLFSLMEGTIEVGEAVQAHIHHREDETVCVEEGQIEFLLNNDTLYPGKGTCIHIARKSTMAFRNKNTTGTRLLFFFTPAGIEEYFHKASPYFHAQPPNTAMTNQLAAEYGMVLLGMPAWND